PLTLFGDGQVPASLEPVIDRSQLRPHLLRDRDSSEVEAPVPVLPTDMGKAEKVERLRLAETPDCPVVSGITPELDQPGLVGVQLEPELRKALTKVMEELLGVTLMLEPADKVVSKAHDDHVTACVLESPLLGPPVKDVMEIDVGEKW